MADDPRLVDVQRSLAAVTAQNERLAQTLRDAREQIITLKEEVDRLAQPPAGFGTLLHTNEDGTLDIVTGGRKLRVNVSPNVDTADLQLGQELWPAIRLEPEDGHRDTGRGLAGAKVEDVRADGGRSGNLLSSAAWVTFASASAT